MGYVVAGVTGFVVGIFTIILIENFETNTREN